jgi:hypothetical protein
LLLALKDARILVRADAAITLGFLREEADTVVPALVACLDDPEDRVAKNQRAFGVGEITISPEPTSVFVRGLPRMLAVILNTSPGRLG